ncbi:ATP-dependent helicase HrpA [Actinokineospora alba]|uniref:RNA helicase n=1 Tax=Actinokineospora alba TaxID=504798 RepID=A0A1H0GKW5_9PSEU|nr:ATP-dependent RNA helicase HrpA [Actinokineospora alba]TDP69940.1 ATP-dependent helicase HrpA [Actinokineospora alba]SDI05485.1 ATP-dependent helicase HrpA [Actinokineospora alba]SDO07577.1 ATP-dependent helicase HrpA [Actinokineospora alba]
MTTATSLSDLRERLPELMVRDQHRLGRRLDGLRGMRDEKKRQALLAKLGAEIETAAQRVAARRASVPKLKYPEELPISQRRADILEAIRDHQVVIVAGETGSGKTTQLPKICLELGRGITGMVGHTQPRRLAARTVAERVAEEVGTPLGESIGWKVRFTDQVGERTLVKVMTDGILLAEIQNDRDLTQYDTLIIDEAHERSLNIDFLLGYLSRLLPKRPDLKVIITSATIDPERFSRHFGDAPIIEVSGRTFPVEVRYRPLVDPEDPDADPDRDQTQGILDAVDELCAEGPGDILVFLSGEREIRDTADALAARNLRNTEILPLYARLSSAEQHRVFQQHSNRRVVLATNVAETSLTVPGIKYVVDPGTARISRYSNRLKVQRLPIEPVSQASANQRKGRCGRTSDGICVRLFSEDDFLARPEFTDPEILRTNLASVILQMNAADLGEMADFPFIEPPDKRHIADGVNLLHELGAINPAETDSRKRLTPLGRKLAQLPVDPRLARMVIEADKAGCVSEVMVIAAALSIQDPRERPQEKQQAAQQMHARFADPDSDFMTYLALWNYLREQQKEVSGNRFRRLCKAEFLNYLRVREWQDIHSQLRQVVRQLGITPNDTQAEPRNVHMALLSGLLSHIGFRDPAAKDGKDYVGARNARFAIFPGSTLAKKPPRWVMAAELVETSRLWGRIAARIEPEWVEPMAEHLVKRTYSEPHWEAKQGSVVAMERVTLFGLPIVVSRKVQYGRIDPEMSRDLFIRNALVEGDWQTRHHFFHDNRKLLAEVEELEHRARRRDIMVDEETLFAFYDQRIPAEVVSGRHFDTWWKKTRHEQPDLLNYSKSMLVNDSAKGINEQDFPDTLQQHGLALPLTYRFEPGRNDDGVTAKVPIAVLNQLHGDGFSLQVPGLREEIVTALIRSLPKPLRRNFVPVPDFAKAVVARLGAEEESLPEAVGRELRKLTGVVIPRDAWQIDAVPAHLRTTFQVVDGEKTLATGKDLIALKDQLKSKLRQSLAAASVDLERRGLTAWTIGTLPKVQRTEQNGLVVTAYPALVDEGDTVAVRMLDTETDQRHAMWLGTRRLVLLGVPSPVKQVVRTLSNQAKLALSHNPHGGVPALLADCVDCAADHLIASGGGPAWTEAGFEKLREHVRVGLIGATLEVLDGARKVVMAWTDVRARLDRTSGPIFVEALADIREQLAGLIYPGFITATGLSRLSDVERYLRGIERRLDKLPERPDRDTSWMHQVQDLEDAYHEALNQLRPAARDSAKAREVQWMIEELRVSYFAQMLGTAGPISDKRILKAVQQLIP